MNLSETLFGSLLEEIAEGAMRVYIRMKKKYDIVFQRSISSRLAAVAKTTTPEELFRIILEAKDDPLLLSPGSNPVRTAALNRIGGSADLLTQLIQLAACALEKIPHELEVPDRPLAARRFWSRADKRFKLRSVVIEALDRISDVTILREYSAASDEYIRSPAGARLREMGDPKAWLNYIQELDGSGFLPKDNVALGMLVESGCYLKMPTQALTQLQLYFVSEDGCCFENTVHHPRGPASPGHGSTPPFTSSEVQRMDWSREVALINKELGRREPEESGEKGERNHTCYWRGQALF